jgi:hypothetical protein
LALTGSAFAKSGTVANCKREATRFVDTWNREMSDLNEYPTTFKPAIDTLEKPTVHCAVESGGQHRPAARSGVWPMLWWGGRWLGPTTSSLPDPHGNIVETRDDVARFGEAQRRRPSTARRLPWSG